MKFPIETPRKQVNWDPKGRYPPLFWAALALPPPPACARLREWKRSGSWQRVSWGRKKEAPGTSSQGGRRVEAAWVPTPESACQSPPVIVPPGLFPNLFKDTSSCRWGWKRLQVPVFASDLVGAGLCVCVCPLFLVIFVSLADGWGASPPPRTRGCVAWPGCPQWERFPGSEWSSGLRQQSLEVALRAGRAS